jgi:RNase P protein component
MTRLRFSRAVRLVRTAEFARVRAEGRSVHGKFMVLTVLRLAGTGALARRVHHLPARSVERSSETGYDDGFAKSCGPTNHTVEPGFWFTLVARAAAKKASFADLRDEWRYLAKASRLLLLDA